MDRQSGHHPEAESSSSASTALSHPPTHPEPSESKSLRTSARVKASKQKFQAEGKGKEFDIAGIEEFVSGETSHSRNTRSAAPTIKNRRSKDTTSVKGKGKEIVDETLPRSHKRCVCVVCDVLNRTLADETSPFSQFTSYCHHEHSSCHQRTSKRPERKEACNSRIYTRERRCRPLNETSKNFIFT